MRRAKKKAKPVDHLAQPVAIETFRDVGPYEMSSLRQDQPTCFNGIVRVHRYRVTFERIDEPDEVIRDRILKLWLESDNIYHVHPLRVVAAKYGLDLDAHVRGSARRAAASPPESREPLTSPTDVWCPWCEAAPNTACVNERTGAANGGVHEARVQRLFGAREAAGMARRPNVGDE